MSDIGAGPGKKEYRILAQICGTMTPQVAESLVAEIRHEAHRVGAVVKVKKTVVKTTMTKKAKKK